MKKLVLVLGIITCMAGLTACGQKEQEKTNLISTQDAMSIADGWVNDVNQIVSSNSEESVLLIAEQNGLDASAFENAFDSWKSASEDIGNYEEIIEITENSMEGQLYNDIVYPMDGEIVARIKGTKHNAEVEIIYVNGMLVSMSTNVEYTFGETMEKAALNTLLGMGTVFVVLILISFIISAFGLISKAQKPKKEPEEEKKADKVVSQIIEKEELSDDLELVAVISAAIAAYEGSGSTDGFVVRSIRKNRK